MKRKLNIIDKKKMNLIFLSSQPRSGSTLTQKILGANEEVYTRSEPWIMLEPAYRLKNVLQHKDYNSLWERRASDNFIEELPESKQSYITALRSMYEELYYEYLKKNNKKLFLDKTPRYYLIINELHEIFPDAKQILLLRNPLSVLRSIIKSWIGTEYMRLVDYKIDLDDALTIFDDFIREKPTWLYIVHYEELLLDPDKYFSEICAYLDIEYNSQMLAFNKDGEAKWEFGDPQNVYTKKGLDKSGIDTKWLSHIDNPQEWRLFYDYLHFIGQERYDNLGYDFNIDKQYLMDSIPAVSLDNLLVTTQSLDSYINPSLESREKNRTEIQLMLRKRNQQIESLESEANAMKNKVKMLEDELHTVKTTMGYKLLRLFGGLK